MDLQSYVTQYYTYWQYITFIFIIFLYLGIVGYQKPNRFVSGIITILLPIIILGGLTLFITYIVSIFENKADQTESKYSKIATIIIYIIGYSAAFWWSKYFNPNLPLYGEGVIFNPYSIFGVGQEYYGSYGNYVKTQSNNIEIQGGKRKKQKGGQVVTFPHTPLSRVYSWILRYFSAILHLNPGNFDQFVPNGISQIFSTIVMAISGYVPHNATLDSQPSWILEFLQYRVNGTSFINYIGGFVRRIMSIGVDLNQMDQIYINPNFNEEGNFIRYIITKLAPAFQDSKTLTFVTNWLFYVMIVFIMVIPMVIKYFINKIK